LRRHRDRALKFGPPVFAVYLLTFCSFVGLGREDAHKTRFPCWGFSPASPRYRVRPASQLSAPPTFCAASIFWSRHRLFGISGSLTMEEWLTARTRCQHLLRVLLKVWMEMPGYHALRSSAIGWLGITPGGAIAASFMGYNLAGVSQRSGWQRQDRGRVRRTAAHASGTSALCRCCSHLVGHGRDPARRPVGVGLNPARCCSSSTRTSWSLIASASRQRGWLGLCSTVPCSPPYYACRSRPSRR
jgi:hypothetical protein